MRAVSTRTVLLIGFALALALAGVVSFYASASPDGLNRVAGELGFSGAQQSSGTSRGPLAGYETVGLGHARLSGGLAGVLGCLVVLGCSSLLLLLRRHAPEPARTGGE